MAVQTPITNSLYPAVAGSLRMELSKFASIANNDTYVSTLGTILAFSFDGGSSAPTCGMTWANSATAGATVTFLVTTGPAVNASLVLWGF